MVRRRILVLLTLCWLATASSVALASELRAAILLSSDADVFLEALEGLEQHLSAALPGLEIDTWRPADGKHAMVREIQRLREKPPDVIIAFGAQAAERVASELPDLPLVVGLLVDRESIRRLGNATGVALTFPVDLELRWARRFVPAGRTLGVLYDPSQNRERIREAEIVARELGIELIARPVTSPQDLPRILRSLSRRIGFLWGISDRTVLTPATAKSVLTFSYEQRIPISGLSERWVEAGALYALDRDYRDLGVQCAELVVQVLDGVPATTLPPQAPRRVSYSVNLLAARHMKLEIDPELVSAASKVIR
jgi:putative ABC transport system substrate-binding protein